MSTRSQLFFYHSKQALDAKTHVAGIYHHCDGYPYSFGSYEHCSVESPVL